MLLTLNQVLNIILTLAAVVVVVFIAAFLNQLRRTAREAERTLARAQDVMDGLKQIELKVNAGLDDVGEVLAITKQAAGGLSRITAFLSTRVSRPFVQYLPLILPLVRLGWQQIKKKKEKEKKDE
jgi:hypothetical protein